MLKLGKNPIKDKYTAEDLSLLSIDTVKKLITDQIPDAFTVKPKKTAKKSPAKKKPAKRLVKR
jgi:DNA topoisomerase-1